MLKKNMHPCYKCDHCDSDERCKISAVFDCYYYPTEFGHQAAPLHERPPLRKFKRRKNVSIAADDFFRKVEENLKCLVCGAVVGSETIVCPKCAKARSVGG